MLGLILNFSEGCSRSRNALEKWGIIKLVERNKFEKKF